MATPVTRRLAAILAADVVGYSRMMGADEPSTVAGLRAHRGELTDPEIAQHHGRIVNTAGDSILAEFPSAVDAVRCAESMQRGMAARNAEIREDRRIVFRIGINVGDVISEGTEIYGDGVNIAARLEGICEPGGIAIGRNVYEQVQGKLPFVWQDAGLQRLKNIAEPVRVYRWRPGATPKRRLALPRPWRRPAVAAAVLVLLAAAVGIAYRFVPPLSPPKRPPLSIAVLPFDNLSRDPEQDYFAAALTDDVITDLSRISGSTVISRNTSFAYKGKAVDVKQVAHNLNVRYVLEGSVQRQGQDVRMTVQLVDGETGAQVWSDRFDRKAENVFALQSEVTGRLARTLNVELLEAESRRVQRGKPGNLDAQDYALRGNTELLKPLTREANREAMRWFQKAVDLDPNLGEGWTGLSFSHARDYLIGWSALPAESSRLALAAAERAVAFDPRSADAYAALALALHPHRQAEKAIAAAEKCISLNRNHAPCYGYKAFALILTGRADQSFRWIAKALALSPQDPFAAEWLWYEAQAHLLLGQHDEALKSARRSLAFNGEFQFAWQVTAAAHANRGELESAKTALVENLKVATPFMRTVSRVRDAFIQLAESPVYVAQLERLFEGLRKAGLPED
jgi:TolB-like protein/class 3 adenylate cyclase/Tfp pilus assembly protein PilF